MKQRREFRWAEFGTDVMDQRERLGLGLRQMARLLDIHHATLCRAERGRQISVADFIFLCDWLHFDPRAYLIERAPSQRSLIAAE